MSLWPDLIVDLVTDGVEAVEHPEGSDNGEGGLHGLGGQRIQVIPHLQPNICQSLGHTGYLKS